MQTVYQLILCVPVTNIFTFSNQYNKKTLRFDFDITHRQHRAEWRWGFLYVIIYLYNRTVEDDASVRRKHVTRWFVHSVDRSVHTTCTGGSRTWRRWLLASMLFFNVFFSFESAEVQSYTVGPLHVLFLSTLSCFFLTMFYLNVAFGRRRRGGRLARQAQLWSKPFFKKVLTGVL